MIKRLDNSDAIQYIMTTSYQYKYSHHKNETIVRSPYLDNRNSNIVKTTYLYWIRARDRMSSPIESNSNNNLFPKQWLLNRFREIVLIYCELNCLYIEGTGYRLCCKWQNPWHFVEWRYGPLEKFSKDTGFFLEDTFLFIINRCRVDSKLFFKPVLLQSTERYGHWVL